MPDVSASSSFIPADPNTNADLKLESAECRRHGYILSGKFLGQGAYAKVYLGQATKSKISSNMKLRNALEPGQKELKVAIKIICADTAPKVYISKFLPREIATMNKCYKHFNVLQLYDMFATVKRVYLILEFATAGDLLTYINKCCVENSPRSVSENNARAMFLGIAAGLRFIHRRGVAHRDLKCENVLLTGDLVAKLSDFGFAIDANESRDLLKTHCGSYAYASPEILKQQKYDGKMADLWSLGVVLFAMVNGGLPFKEADAKSVLAAMKKPVYFKTHLSRECKELIRGLLKIKPQRRLNIEEVLCHPWVTRFCHPEQTLVIKIPLHSSHQHHQSNQERDLPGGDTEEDEQIMKSFEEQHVSLDDATNVSKYLQEKMNFGQTGMVREFARFYAKPSTKNPVREGKSSGSNVPQSDGDAAQFPGKEPEKVAPQKTGTTNYSASVRARHKVIAPEIPTPDKESRLTDRKLTHRENHSGFDQTATEKKVENIKAKSKSAGKKTEEITKKGDIQAENQHNIDKQPRGKTADQKGTTTKPASKFQSFRPRAWVVSRGEKNATDAGNNSGRETASPNVINIRIDHMIELNSNTYKEFQRVDQRKKPIADKRKGEKSAPFLNKREEQYKKVKQRRKEIQENKGENVGLSSPTVHKMLPTRNCSNEKISEKLTKLGYSPTNVKNTPLMKTRVKAKSTSPHQKPSNDSGCDKKSDSPKNSNETVKDIKQKSPVLSCQAEERSKSSKPQNTKERVKHTSASATEKKMTPLKEMTSKPTSLRCHTTTPSKENTQSPPCNYPKKKPMKCFTEIGELCNLEIGESPNNSPSIPESMGYAQSRPFSRKIRAYGAGEWPARFKDSVQESNNETPRFAKSAALKNSPAAKELLDYRFYDRKIFAKSKTQNCIRSSSVTSQRLPSNTSSLTYKLRNYDNQNFKILPGQNNKSRAYLFRELRKHQEYVQSQTANYGRYNDNLKGGVVASDVGRLLYRRVRESRPIVTSKRAVRESVHTIGPKYQNKFLPSPSCGLTYINNASCQRVSPITNKRTSRNSQREQVVLKLCKG